MPSIWTHMLFCEDVIDTIDKNTSLFMKHETIMKLGAQGPDPFFYYNFWSLFGKKKVQHLGKIMHEKRCGKFLLDMVIQSKQMNESVKAYVFGYITHLILDKNTHPYIYNRSNEEGMDEQKLEIIIDTIMMETYHNLETWKTRVHKEIDIGFSIDKDIASLLTRSIHKHYPNVACKTKYIQKAYRDMKLALMLFIDHHSWKNAIFKPFSPYHSYEPVKNKRDYLNITHKTWLHPKTKHPSSKSFIDLYEMSKMEAQKLMKEIIKYWTNDEIKPSSQLKKTLLTFNAA